MPYDDDSVPFDIEEPVDIGDLSDQQSTDVIEPVQRVPFVIKKASVRTGKDKDTGTWLTKKLVVEAAIDDEGVDGNGKYARKRFFPELMLTFNSADFPDKFSSDWWQKQSRGPTKEFFVALGYDPKALPRVDDNFLTSLAERSFIANITRREMTQKDSQTGEYAGTGEFRNELRGFRRAISDSNGDQS